MKRSMMDNAPMVAALVAAAAPGVAHAQAGIERRAGQSPTDPLATPEFRPPPAQPFAAPPPSAFEAAPPGRAATSQSFVAHAIVVRGATVVPNEYFKPITDRYLNRPITVSDLLEMRDAITATYVEGGYINSGAVISDQDVSDGIIDVNIVEGRLTGIEVNGLRRLNEDYVASRMQLPGDRPLTRTDLQRRFERLARDPNLIQLNARLRPGGQLGEAILTLDAREASGWIGEVEAATDRSPSVGGERAVARTTIRNVLGWGDRTAFEFGATEGLVDGAFSFSTPLNRHDLTLTVDASGSDADVVEEPLNELDIVSKSYSGRVALAVPVWRSSGEAHTATLTAGLGVSYSYAQTELLGDPFSFSPGSINGETRLTVARQTLDFALQSPRTVFAARSTISYGIDALEPQIPQPDTLKTNFLVWSGQAQFAQAVTESGQRFLARLDAQVAADSLFALEQFSFGGIDSVRGYRKNQALTDNGAVASIEYQLPLRDLELWRPEPAFGAAHWFGSIFVDAGHGWNTDLPDPAIQTLTSAGLALHWRPNDRVSCMLYGAAQLEELDDPAEERLQDYGVGFRLTARLW